MGIYIGRSPQKKAQHVIKGEEPGVSLSLLSLGEHILQRAATPRVSEAHIYLLLVPLRSQNNNEFSAHTHTRKTHLHLCVPASCRHRL